VALDDETAPLQRYRVLREELRRYSPTLLDVPEIVVLSKTDIADGTAIAEAQAAFAAECGWDVESISAVTGQGVASLVQKIWSRLRDLRDPAPGV
jgi:GTP-binding protein